ncbi:unnamed protein product [Symbiodinium sp. CCMP2592]|nr:unnamed protein product [Symbiodinium sp. CCMP2592]
MDLVPFTAATGNNNDGGIGGRQEQEANQYFLQLLQENNQVNVFLNDPRIQSALELRAEQRHRFALDNVYAEANAYIAHLEATADANHRQQLAFVSQSTHLLLGQLHNEVRVLETIARAEQRTANELQAQLARTQRESHDERSLAMQFDAHRSELEAAARTLTAENRQHEHRFAEMRASFDENHSELIAFLGSEFEEKLQWEENEFQYRLTSEEQQYDNLVDDLQDRNAELIAEVNSLRTVLSTAQSSPPQGGAMPVKVDKPCYAFQRGKCPRGDKKGGGKGGKGGDKKDTSKIPCIFYPKGTCKNGKNCPFMHKDASPSVPAKGDKSGKDGKRSPSGKRRRPSKKRAKSEEKTAACCLSIAATLTGEPSPSAGKSYAVAARKGHAVKSGIKKVQFLRPEIIDIPLEGEGWRFVTEKRKYEFRYKSADRCPPSIPEDTEEALQNARHLESAVNGTIDGMLSGKVFSPAGAAEDPSEKMANCIPPIPGVETRQLLKAGWTVINGSPDDVWSLLEDSVNIDEFDGIYGEAQADSDVEPYTMPTSKKDDWWDGETYFDLAGGYQKFNKKQKQLLHQSKFLLPTAQLKLPAQKAMVCLKLCVGSPLDEGGRLNKPRSRFENDSFARTSLECTNTQQTASLDREIMAPFMCTTAIATLAGSDLPDLPEATSTILKMAAVVVSDEFGRVNTAEADRTGVTKAMKTLLQSAALNNDIISLGADHEYAMLESAYSCVSTQCAAGVSLTHADATCAALRQMADLSDEGLAKLKPTARLSPKAKRAIVVVSDSSTAKGSVCQDRLGCGSEHRKHVEEHIKELRANFPDHIIDVICWWCGNEISGQWGCIPTRLGPGLAYRDPNVTTETVARKVRRAADVLAALAGEPDIGFVKVIGQVEADLFQLHSAYNDFNAAMFEEFRQRNLQVQSASSLVEKLEMYDSFHASEDPRNRGLFQAYLHATFNASRSEWIAQKMAPCVKALITRYEHFETGTGANNPVLQDVFKQWREERDQLLNPKQAKPMPVTQEDKMWEAPDAADANDISKIAAGPPMDKAIRKDVPRFGATTDVSAVAECVNDIVTQDADGKVSYSVPGTVELVDEGDKVDPIPSSMGRVMEPAAPKKTKKSDRDEDAVRRLMFVDESAPQEAATVPEKLPNEYFYNGAKHLMKPFNPEDIVGDKHVFNTARDARWGVRQLLHAAKANNKGRIRLLGIDVPMKDTLGQPLFPVRVRMAQGHNQKLIGNNPDADFFLATRFYSGLSQDDAELQSSVKGVTVLSREDTPAKLYHRTNERGMKGILRDGMIAGSARSDRSHNYLSPYRLDDTNCKSGMRSNQPIELAIDTQRAIAAGCVFFVTETDGVLTRDILSAVDTSKKNLPLYVAENKEATREGEPVHVFRAKRDYEEAAASSSSAPPPKQAAIAPKATASKKMPKVAPKPTAVAKKDDDMDLDEATRKGKPADADVFAPDVEAKAEEEEGDTTDAGEDEPYPRGSHPCRECAAVVANGMLFCLRCKAPQFRKGHKASLRKLEAPPAPSRATGAQKPIEDLLASDLRGLGDGPKKRGQMSAEAAVIRDAKDRRQRAFKLNFESLSYRFEHDNQFSMRMMQEGRSIEDMQKFDHLANAVLPDPGRSEEQRYLRAGSHYGGGNVPPAKLVYYAHCEVEPLRSLRFIDETADVPIGLTYMGAFLPPRLFAEVAAVNDAAKRILTFDGEVYLSATTTEGITTEIGQIISDSLRSARDQTHQTERLAERNRQAAAQNRPSQKGRGRAADPEPMYRGYTQAQWDESYRQRRGGYTQAEWDAWTAPIGVESSILICFGPVLHQSNFDTQRAAFDAAYDEETDSG